MCTRAWAPKDHSFVWRDAKNCWPRQSIGSSQIKTKDKKKIESGYKQKKNAITVKEEHYTGVKTKKSPVAVKEEHCTEVPSTNLARCAHSSDSCFFFSFPVLSLVAVLDYGALQAPAVSVLILPLGASRVGERRMLPLGALFPFCCLPPPPTSSVVSRVQLGTPCHAPWH